MFSIKGEIQFIYNNTPKQVEYVFNNHAGVPMFSFTDKRGHHHQFIKVFGTTWKSYCNKEPNWPEDFLMVLYAAFELEFQVIYNSHKNALHGISGI